MTERFEHTLGDADTLMWHIDRDPHLRSTIVTVLVLDRAPSWPDVVARLERGSRLVPRLRQRVVEPPLRIGPPAWSADPDFDLSYHLRRVRAPEATLLRRRPRRRGHRGDGRLRPGAPPLGVHARRRVARRTRAAVVLKVHHSMTRRRRRHEAAAHALRPRARAVGGSARTGGRGPADLHARGTRDPGARVAGPARRVDGARRRGRRGVARRAGAARRHRPDDRACRAHRRLGRAVPPAGADTASHRSSTRGASTGASGTMSMPLEDLKLRGEVGRAGRSTTRSSPVHSAGCGGTTSLHGGEVDELRMIMPINIRAATARARRQPLRAGAPARPARDRRPRAVASREVAIREAAACRARGRPLGGSSRRC